MTRTIRTRKPSRLTVGHIIIYNSPMLSELAGRVTGRRHVVRRFFPTRAPS
jgi:hypothetical protein